MNCNVFGIGVVALLLTPVAFGAANQTGINVDYLYDSDNTPLLADMMRTYRTANNTTSLYNKNDALLDSSGWATTDAWYFLGDQAAIKHGDGTYALKFTGQATVTVANAGNVSQSYDANSNTTTATIITNSGTDLTELHFTNTQRTASSGTNTGVTNVQLMRPTTPGGSTPYSFGTTFTDQTKTIAAKTSVLRFMDYLATNNNLQDEWYKRVKPTDVKLNPNPDSGSNSRGKGGPLELAVQLGNETNRDIWINVPALASDDYVTKMAKLIKYGSDGTNPYDSPQANPVFKPLNSNLHVYLEYSNETWNTGFSQYGQIAGKAAIEAAAEGSNGAITYNGNTGNTTYMVERYNALRTKQIAEMFAGVFGQNALLDTVRPILAWQYGNGNDTANQAVGVLDGYFNNAKGNFVGAAKPINSYIYGGGSAMYYSPTSATSDLTVEKIVTEPAAQMASQAAKMAKDLAYTTSFGIKRVAYEGGLSLDPGNAAETPASMAAKLSAYSDYRLRQLVVANHNTWTNQGGDLLVYYFSTDQYKFAMSDEYFSTSTQKLSALDDLANSQATANYSVGTALSRTRATTISGGQFSIVDNGYSPYPGALTLKGGNWASYLINIPTAGDYVITAAFQTYAGGAANFQLLLGGGLIADYQSLVSLDKYRNAPGVLLTLPAGITSLRVLMGYNSGDISLSNVAFSPVPGTSPIPEPTALTGLAVAGAGLLRRRRRKTA